MLFGGRTPAEGRFGAARWMTGATGAPMLVGAAMALGCRVSSTQTVGTHRVLFGAVADVRLGKAEALLACAARGFHTVTTG